MVHIWTVNGPLWHFGPRDLKSMIGNSPSAHTNYSDYSQYCIFLEFSRRLCDNVDVDGTMNKVANHKLLGLRFESATTKTRRSLQSCNRCYQRLTIAHLSLPWSNGWLPLSFLVCCSFVCSSCYGNTRPNLPFLQYIQALKNTHINPVPLNSKQYQVILTQYHQEPTSTAPYWPSTIVYQPQPYWPSYHNISYSNVRLSFVDLRWAQLYISLVSLANFTKRRTAPWEHFWG